VRAANLFFVLLGVCALCAPLLGIYPVFMMKLLCFAMFACAYNLLMALAACCRSDTRLSLAPRPTRRAWLATARGWDAAPAILAGVAAAALVGLLVGLIAIRRRGIYFAMITLASGAADFFRVPGGTLHRR